MRLQRTQILLDPEQQKELAAIAEREKKSVSKIVRDMIEKEIKLRKREQLARAARLAVQDYTTGGELTAFTALDGDDFNA
jgi:predicted DNA-binding protein